MRRRVPGGCFKCLLVLERGRTSSPAQVSALRATGTGRGCAPAHPATSSEGSRLDPSSRVDPGPLPRDWHITCCFSSSTTASVTGDSGQPQLNPRQGRQQWLEMLGQLRALADPFGRAQASATGPSLGEQQTGSCPQTSPWDCSHLLLCVGPLLPL